MELAATIKNGEKITEVLLKNGFVPDYPQGGARSGYKSSALYQALLERNYETAKVLLKYGARTDITREREVLDLKTGKLVRVQVGMKERFKDDPEALKVLGAKKGIFDGF